MLSVNKKPTSNSYHSVHNGEGVEFSPPSSSQKKVKNRQKGNLTDLLPGTCSKPISWNLLAAG